MDVDLVVRSAPASSRSVHSGSSEAVCRRRRPLRSHRAARCPARNRRARSSDRHGALVVGTISWSPSRLSFVRPARRSGRCRRTPLLPAVGEPRRRSSSRRSSSQSRLLRSGSATGRVGSHDHRGGSLGRSGAPAASRGAAGRGLGKPCDCSSRRRVRQLEQRYRREV